MAVGVEIGVEVEVEELARQRLGIVGGGERLAFGKEQVGNVAAPVNAAGSDVRAETAAVGGTGSDGRTQWLALVRSTSIFGDVKFGSTP